MGFLLAAIIAVAIMPAVHDRAVRITTRRSPFTRRHPVRWTQRRPRRKIVWCRVRFRIGRHRVQAPHISLSLGSVENLD